MEKTMHLQIHNSKWIVHLKEIINLKYVVFYLLWQSIYTNILIVERFILDYGFRSSCAL